MAADLTEALAAQPLTEADCVAIAKLRPLTSALGLSLADRACLVLAERLGGAGIDSGPRLGTGGRGR